MTNRRTTLGLVLIVVLACLIGAGARAATTGGVLLDGLQVTNDGTPVFTESFAGGSMRAWKDIRDVALTPTNVGGYLMHMNRHGQKTAMAWRNLTADTPGLMEVTTRVFVMPLDQQYGYEHREYSLLDITLYSGNAPNTIREVVNLNPKDKANRVSLGLQRVVTEEPPPLAPKVQGKPQPPVMRTQKGQLKGYGATTPTPVIQPSKWATLTLRLDPKTGTATVLVDGKQVLSQSYDTSAYKSLSAVSIHCSYGDGAKLPK